VHLGLQLDHAGAGVSAEAMLRQARHAEGCGLDSVWLFDHLLTPVVLRSHYPYDVAYGLRPEDPILDPLGVIGVLAGATSRIQLGTEVFVAPYRHPIVLGKALATIERFAPGRLICGLGSGWMQEEFDALGVPFAARGTRMDEYVAALRAVWSGTPVAFDGTAYGWEAAGFNPAPTSPVPILLGGHAPRARARAIRLGDGWATILTALPDPSMAGSLQWLEAFRREREEAGRGGDGFEVLVCEQPVRFSAEPDPGEPLSGPPEAIAEAIARLRDAGVTKIAVLADDEGVARLAEEVRPIL
jgi:probable F420-dependent oxidoreductase